MAYASTETVAAGSTQNMGQHPNPIPNPHYRKIDLQSHADLTYLQRNLAIAAREKLDIYFPHPVPKPPALKSAPPATIISLDGPRESLTSQQAEEQANEEIVEVDPLRAPVTALIDEFLRETYTSAANSIAVNGIDASVLASSHFPTASNPTPDADDKDGSAKTLDLDQEVEGIHYTYAPFDRKLQKKMQALYEEVEALTGQVASLRREVPQAAAQNHIAMLEAAMAKDEEMWDDERQALENETYTGLELDPLRQGWNEDVRAVYERGSNDLAALSGTAGKHLSTTAAAPGVASLPETVGKVERARNVASEFD